jgi:competence ComEA-like helix-hairpin-helix protein
MAPLDSSVLCTIHQRRRFMSYLVLLVVLLSAFPLTVSPATAGPSPATTTAAAVDAKININTADVKELMKLNGVGRNLAEKIVQYRDAHGPFKKATDLRKVEGLGDGLWEKNRERIVVK